MAYYWHTPYNYNNNNKKVIIIKRIITNIIKKNKQFSKVYCNLKTRTFQIKYAKIGYRFGYVVHTFMHRRQFGLQNKEVPY